MNSLKLKVFVTSILIFTEMPTALFALQSTGFEGSGHIIYHSRKTGKEVVQRRDFRIVVSSCKSKIVVTNFPQDSDIGSAEYLNNGDNVFLILGQFTTNLDEFKAFLKRKGRVVYRGQEQLSPDSVKDFNPFNVTIQDRDNPQPTFEAGTLMLPLWLAYGSACYFHSRSNSHLVERAFLPGEGVNRSKFPIRADFTFYQDRMQLISSLRYLGDGNEYVVKGNAVKVTEYPNPYNHGFVEVEYMVDATTNINDITIPTAFTINRYRPTPNGVSTNDVDAFSNIQGFLDYVKVNDALEVSTFSSDLPVKAMITDRRFPADPKEDTRLNLNYQMTNGVIPSLSSVEGRKEYKLLAVFHGIKGEGDKKRYVVYILFIMLFALPLLTMAYSRIKNTKLNKRKV